MKRKNFQFYGQVRLPNRTTHNFEGIWAADVVSAISKMQTIYKDGFQIKTIRMDAFDYPELNNVRFEGRVKKIKEKKSESLLSGLEDAYEKTRTD